VVYCFDTSALLDGWVRYYPPDVFPSLWEKLHEMIQTGELIAPEEVYNELEHKEDSLFAWVKDREGMFVQLDDELQGITADVLRKHPKLVGELKDRNRADPFVISLALKRGAIVITAEKPGSENKPRIPWVCARFGIKSMGLLELIREKKWSFTTA
jgi:Domain of unknown function (DUF4411)